MCIGGEFTTQHQALLWTPAASFYSTQLCHPPPENNIISQRLGLSTARQPPLSHPSLKLEVQIIYSRASQVVLVVKNPPANAGGIRDAGSVPGSGRSPGGGRARQPTPVFLPGESHGQRSLAGFSPLSFKESDMTGKLNTITYSISGCQTQA